MYDSSDKPVLFSKAHKRILVASLDVLLLWFSLWAANSMWFGELYLPVQSQLWLFAMAPLLAVPVFSYLGLYRAVIRYLGEQALLTVVKGVASSTLIWAAVVWLSGFSGGPTIPLSVVLNYWVLATLLIVGSRLLVRELIWRPVRNRFKGNNVLVYGAGEAGVQLVKALWHTEELFPMGFIDDDARMHNREVAGLNVFPLSRLGEVIKRYDIREILLALPSASRARRGEIIGQLQKYHVHARVLPSVSEIVEGKISVRDLREVEVEDLLGRDSVPPDATLLNRNIRDKSVLVTGAGGSIGSELCRQLIRLQPKKLVVLDSCEHALYQIDRLMSEVQWDSKIPVVPVLGSVLNAHLVEHVLREHEVQTVYHAAAYKHVPLMESNEFEGVTNNVFGTLNVAEASMKQGVETFVLISTDKAVRPANMMGASKRLAELILQALHDRMQSGLSDGEQAIPVFCMVRFGNVLDSSGSVIPLFREQIHNGGPVTVTHPNVTRYFMSIPEAAQLVLQAGAMAKGGDVFVLDMGEPVRILDLARQMIRLSGLEVLDEEHTDGDIKIEFTGLRPGEKLYEELLIGNNPIGTTHSKIMRAEEEMKSWAKVRILLDDIRAASVTFDVDRLRALVMGVANGSSVKKPPLVPFRKRPALKAVKDVVPDNQEKTGKSSRKNIH